MTTRLSLSDIQNVARRYDGKCLSKEYTSNSIPLKWMCKRGHTWDSPYSNVNAGWWCSQCKKEDIKLQHYEKFKGIVEAKGWTCLSEKFINWETKLKLECDNGHKLAMKPMGILHGYGCRQCIIDKQKQEELDRVKEIARKKGGRCLSGKYKSYQSVLTWQCAKGHKWTAQARFITEGHWCKFCNREEKCKDDLKQIARIAKEHGGKCLSEKHVNDKTKLIFQCSEGHIWKSFPQTIKRGHWCYKCNTAIVHQRRRKHTAEELQKYAASRGGKMLSPVYGNYVKPLLWQCSEGHTWKASVYSVVGKGSWCRKCFSKTLRLDFDQIKRSARKYGGTLLSKEYKDAKSVLQWKCKSGHVFEALPRDVRNGKWCADCEAEQKFKINIKQRGTKLLTPFQGSNLSVLLKCKNGHTWKTKPQRIKNGVGCPTCRLDDLRLAAIARKRNSAGQFLPLKKSNQKRNTRGPNHKKSPRR